MIGSIQTQEGRRIPGWVADGLCVLAVLAAVCLRAGNYCAPTVMPDEMGYWCAGAFFAGFSWADVMGTSPYYSFGYGLILAPLFHLFEDPVWMFRAAIVLNGLFLVGVYLLAADSIRRVNLPLKSGTRRLAALALALYSYQIYNAQATQPDTVMVFFYWLVIWLLIGLLHSDRLWRTAALAVSVVYLFTLHMRNLGIVIALCLLYLVLILCKVVRSRHIFVLVVMMTVGFAAVFAWKDIYTTAVWQGSAIADINNTNTAFSTVGSLLSWQGLVQLAVNLLGRIFYLGCSTFLMFYWALWQVLRTLAGGVRRRRLQPLHWLQLFCLLAMMGEMGISSLFMIQPTRIDQILYGRYHEQVLGPLLLFGIAAVDRLSAKRTLLLLSLFHLALGGGLFAWIHAHGLQQTDYYPPSMAGVLAFPLPASWPAALRYTLGAAGFSILCFVLLWLLVRMMRRPRAALAVLSAGWMLLGWGAGMIVLENGQYAKAVYADLAAAVRTNYSDREIYYVVSDGFPNGEVVSTENFTVLNRKFFFPRTSLHLIEPSQLPQLAGRQDTAVIVEENYVDADGLGTEYFLAMQCGSTQLWLSDACT